MDKFLTIDNTLDYIYSFVNLENQIVQKHLKKEYSLENIKNILTFFGNPEKNKKIFHVAGTKGKGSTSFFTSILLIKLGFKVTTFVSPHLIKPNERILFNLKNITDNDLIEIINEIEPVLTKNKLIPTTFELFFLIFLIFSKNKNSDYLVIEVGLGGRLDSTNVINPLISVITSISYDHTNILGNTIEQIASEKAGIIKNKSITVISKQPYKCENIFKKIALEKENIFFSINNIFKTKNIIQNEKGLIFDCSSKFFSLNKFELKNIYGKHQINNFLTALLSVYLINPKIIEIINKNPEITNNLKGRIEVINTNPLIILDVSHNKDSAKNLKKTLKSHFKINKWLILSGMALDKDYIGFYSEIKSITKELIITTPVEYKKSNPALVFNTAKSIIKNTIFIENLNDAIKYSISKKEPLLVTGSFYVAGPFIEFWNKNFTNKN
jgi:dihydrofolate synthase / folylpolyglutamate synthase